MPFAMTQWTPQTRLTENKCIPPYFYKDSLLSGFRGTHWLSGSCTQDYGSFTIMPITGQLKTVAVDYSVPFLHTNETATPAYYKLELPEQHLVAEITATNRCGFMQFTLLQDDSIYLLVMPNSDYSEGTIQVDKTSGMIWGHNPVHRIYQGWGKPAGFSGHFFIQVEKKIGNAGTFAGANVFEKDTISNQQGLGVYIGFACKKDEQIRIRTGTSFTSARGARNNLATEIKTWDFNTVLQAANKTWEKALSQVTVTTNNEKDKRIFYTAMYHAMQHPRLYNDVDGSYPKFAGNHETRQLSRSNYYDDFSMWDIYRAQIPLMEILHPKRVNDFVSSLITKGTQGGWLPVFPCWNSYTSAMIGDHATMVIASAFAKGMRNYDVKEAYRLMRKNAFDVASNEDYNNGMGRRALPSYLQYGYIPLEDSVPVAFHKKEQVSRTLEYAYDDYALSVVSKF
jgi:predicted alpha-1,2-mannosidase